MWLIIIGTKITKHNKSLNVCIQLGTVYNTPQFHMIL